MATLITDGPSWSRLVDSLKYSRDREKFNMAVTFRTSVGKYHPREKVIIMSLDDKSHDEYVIFIGLMEINGNNFCQAVVGRYNPRTHTGEFRKLSTEEFTFPGVAVLPEDLRR